MTAASVALVAVLAGGIAIAASAIGVGTVAQRAVRPNTPVQVADTVPAPSTPYRLPVDPDLGPGWNPTHHDYPATDVFLGCGADVFSPVRGTVSHVRRVDAWDPSVDDPATRGGRSVAVVGDDGVRYYFAHFASIEPGIEVGDRVVDGRRLGAIGASGRASGCHLHVGISPPCPQEEWSVRRGVVWPYPYLDDWRAGGRRSPAPEVRAWAEAHPDACAVAATTTTD